MREKVKSRSVSGTQLKPRWVSPSWCRGCCALRGKSLDRRRWSAVMGLPSAVHVHSHGRSYTEIAAECSWMRTMTWVFPPTPFSDWWVRKVKTSQKSVKFPTDIGESEKCFHKVELFNLKKLLYIVVIRKVGQKLQISDQQNFFNLS